MKLFTELRIVFTVITGILAIGIAFMDMLDGAGPEKAQQFREWCGTTWEQIRTLGWMELPRPMVKRLVRAKAQFSYNSVSFCEQRWFLYTAGGLAVIAWGVITFDVVSKHDYHKLIYGFDCGLVMLLSASAMGIMFTRMEDKYTYVILMPLSIILVGSFVFFVTLTFEAAIALPFQIAVLCLVFVAPFLGWLSAVLFTCVSITTSCLFFPMGTPKHFVSNLIVFGLTLPLSFAITVASLAIGHHIDPSLWLPRAWQMMLSNVMFDSLTVVVTLNILGWSVPEKEEAEGQEENKGIKERRLSLLIAIPAACLIAGVFACTSLWCGLGFSPHAVSPLETLHALIGRSPDGHRWSFGPLFWTMHTTFIPVLIVLSAIVLLWIAHLVVISPVYGWLGMSKEETASPFKVTKGFLGIWAALFMILSGTSWWLSETMPKEAVTPPTASTQKRTTP
jgi:hypothetical protein